MCDIALSINSRFTFNNPVTKGNTFFNPSTHISTQLGYVILFTKLSCYNQSLDSSKISHNIACDVWIG